MGNEKNAEKIMDALHGLNCGEFKEVELDNNDSEGWFNRRNPATFKEFPLDTLPVKMRRYVEEKARALNQNPAALAFSLLVVAGACIGAAVKVKLGTDRFTASFLWLGLLGRSGCGKTPILEAGTKLIADVEKEFRQDHIQKFRQYKAESAKYERSLKSSKAAACDMVPPEPPQERKVTIQGTSTIEGIHKDIQANPRGLLIVYDELGSFFGDTQRRAGSSSEWLAGYDGRSICSSRKVAKEVYIPEAYWSIVGGCTPEKMAKFFTDTGHASDGMLSRFCLIWQPDIQGGLSREDISDETIQQMKSVMERLVRLEYVAGQPYVIRLDDMARNAWFSWQDEMYTSKMAVNTDQEASQFSKSEDLPARVAVILHILEIAESRDDFSLADVPQLIPLETFQRAEKITRWIMQETRYCFQRLLTSGEDVGKSEILGALTKNGEPMTVRDFGQVISKYRSDSGKGKLLLLLESLVSERVLVKDEYTAANNRQVVRYGFPGTGWESYHD